MQATRAASRHTRPVKRSRTTVMVGFILVMVTGISACGGRSEERRATEASRPPETSAEARNQIGDAKWSFAGAKRGGREIDVKYRLDGGRCEKFRSARVAETPQEVQITVLTERDENAGCAGKDATKVATVTLRAPLRDRRLVDGATGKVVPR